MVRYLFIDGFKKQYGETIAVIYDITEEKTAVKVRRDIQAYPIDSERIYVMLTGSNIYRIVQGNVSLDNF